MIRTCPFTLAEITADCGIRECDLWLESSDYHHCGWQAYAMLSGGTDGLNWPDIARLLQTTEVAARTQTQQALDQVRLERLRERVAPVPQWRLLRGSARCVVCRRPVRIQEQGWGWCSRACYRWSPPVLLALEEQLGTHLHTALQNRTINDTTLARILGLDLKSTHWLLWQRLGLAPKTRRWRKSPEPLVKNPGLPSVTALRARLRRAGGW